MGCSLTAEDARPASSRGEDEIHLSPEFARTPESIRCPRSPASDCGRCLLAAHPEPPARLQSRCGLRPAFSRGRALTYSRIGGAGATGYIGGRIVPHLLEHGYAVRCLARSPANYAAGSGGSSAARGAPVGPFRCCHAGARSSRLPCCVLPGPFDVFGRQRVRGPRPATRVRVRGAARAAGVDRIIYLWRHFIRWCSAACSMASVAKSWRSRPQSNRLQRLWI